MCAEWLDDRMLMVSRDVYQSALDFCWYYAMCAYLEDYTQVYIHEPEFFKDFRVPVESKTVETPKLTFMLFPYILDETSTVEAIMSNRAASTVLVISPFILSGCIERIVNKASPVSIKWRFTEYIYTFHDLVHQYFVFARELEEKAKKLNVQPTYLQTCVALQPDIWPDNETARRNTELRSLMEKYKPLNAKDMCDQLVAYITKTRGYDIHAPAFQLKF